MTILVFPVPPPREVEAVLSHGGRLLTLTVQRHAGVSKRTGEVRYRSHTTTYLVERGVGLVRLIRENGGDLLVSPAGCSCPDASFKGNERLCKHFTAVVDLGLLGVAGDTQGG